eukprot:1632332-Pyramimonas_sp.AAC.1
MTVVMIRLALSSGEADARARAAGGAAGTIHGEKPRGGGEARGRAGERDEGGASPEGAGGGRASEGALIQAS